MPASDDIFALGCTMMRAQANAMQYGDDNGRHARALRRLIDRAEVAMSALARMPFGTAASALLEPIECELEAALAEARDAVDG